MPRARSQYIAEMRERFEVVDRVKASAEEKASLTKAIHQEDSDPSSVENTPSKVVCYEINNTYWDRQTALYLFLLTSDPGYFIPGF